MLEDNIVAEEKTKKRIGRPKGSTGKHLHKYQRAHLNDICYRYLTQNFVNFKTRDKQHIALSIYLKTIQGPLIENHSHYVKVYQWISEDSDTLRAAAIPEGNSQQSQTL